jgi:hypothetical protein
MSSGFGASLTSPATSSSTYLSREPLFFFLSFLISSPMYSSTPLSTSERMRLAIDLDLFSFPEPSLSSSSSFFALFTFFFFCFFILFLAGGFPSHSTLTSHYSKASSSYNFEEPNNFSFQEPNNPLSFFGATVF